MLRSLPSLDYNDPLSTTVMEGSGIPQLKVLDSIVLLWYTQPFHELLQAKPIQESWVQHTVFLKSYPWTSNIGIIRKIGRNENSTPDLSTHPLQHTETSCAHSHVRSYCPFPLSH